jgi:hypothetical protein
MGRFLDALLDFKNEDTATKKVGLFAFLMITATLALLSVSGAIAMSEGDGFKWIIRIVFALLIAGAEILAAVIFVRAILAGSKLKMFVCLLIWLGLAWTCVQNAKEGAHAIFGSRYDLSSTELAEQARIAGEEAATLATAQDAAIGGTGAELERVRTQIAELKTEQQIMASMSPEGISKAQSLLLAQGLYFGSVDGIRQDKTESGMRARGEAIQREMTTLKAREDGLMQGQASPVQQATSDRRMKEVALKAAADKAWWDGVKLEVMLWVLEAARSLGLWAAFTNVTAGNVSRVRSREDELAEAEHQARLAAIRAAMVPAAPPIAAEPDLARIAAPEQEPAPVVTPEPEPIVLVEPVEMTEQERRSRLGGLAAQHQRRADKTERLLVIGPTSTIDTLAMGVAAE